MIPATYTIASESIQYSPNKYINMDESDESDKFQLQQPNREYWEYSQLPRITPKIDQMSKKSCSRLSRWIKENDISSCPAENIKGRKLYSTYETAISSTIISNTTQELDPISMLMNTLQCTRISQNSLFTDNQRSRSTVFFK